MTLKRFSALLLCAAALTACAGPVAERAFEDVSALAEQRIGQRPAWIRTDADEAMARETMDRLLAAPLTAESSVQLALLNNRRLQAGLSELGIGAAELTAAWRPGNPHIGFSRMRRSGEVEIERSFGIEAISVLTIPFRAAIEERRFERTKLNAAIEVMALAAQARRAWIEAVAAEQTARAAAEYHEAAATAADLRRRMRQVGSASLLDQVREQLLHADAAVRLAKSRAAALAAREKLARVLGLWGTDLSFKLPESLPDLPTRPREARDVEARAIAERLDVQMARADVDALRRAYGLTNATRIVNVLETGFVRKSEDGRSDQVGYEVSLEVPIFDLGDAKATKAEHLYLQAVNRLADTAVTARSTARETYIGYRTAFDLAQHYQNEILPLRQKMGEEVLLRYNGMLLGVFDLLSDARDRIADRAAGIEALRDFWLADTDLAFVTIAPVEAGAVSSLAALPRGRSAAAH